VRVKCLESFQGCLTEGKVYDILDINKKGRVSFYNDNGFWDTATEKQYEIFEEVEVTTKPPQYNIGIDTFERMRANAKYEEAMGFIRWNIDKYNTRQKGQDKQDYEKIISYAQEALWWIKNNE
jgi:hypothetical protein